VWWKGFKLGATINRFTAIQNRFCVSLRVLIEKSQRIYLGNAALTIVESSQKWCPGSNCDH
jgi:hypothetical protein